MSAQHTPGPWWATDYGVRDSGGYICATTKPSRYDGQDERFARETAQREADVRLITTAPELLAELSNAADQLQGWVNWKCPKKHVPEHEAYIAKLRALIAKAGGTA